MSNVSLYGQMEPEVVYHYTSMGTLLKILKKPVIHATGVNYLNDTTEREYFFRLVQRRLPSYISENAISETSVFTTFRERALNLSAERALDVSPFVASFSEEGDLLNQWRSYCPEGNGVSIGFRAECLRSVSFPSTDGTRTSWQAAPFVEFGKVTYLRDDDTEFVDSSIRRAVTQATRMEADFTDGDADGAIPADDLFAWNIEKQASFVKHAAFSNEQEYRLLVGPMFLDYSYLEFRPSKSTLIPYVEAPIALKASRPLARSLVERLTRGNGDDFIAEVVIGPTPNVELSIDSLQALLRKKDLVAHVRASKVPFREI